MKNNNYTQHFITSERSDGAKFVCLKDNAPKELSELVCKIHLDYFYKCLPNDWIYSIVVEAFSDLSNDKLDDITIESDIYNVELTTWLNDNCNQFAHEYCQEWLTDSCSIGSKLDVIRIISGAQQFAKERIYHAVNDWIQKQKEVKE